MNAVYRLHRVRRGIQRVNAQMRPGGMRGFAVKVGHHRRRGGVVHRRRRLALRTLLQRPEVEAEQHLHVVQHARFRQRDRPCTQLFGRLKEYFQLPAFYQPLGEDLFRGGQHHRRVPVMATGMASLQAAINHMAQRIHIRPQRHDRPRLTAIQQRNNAGGTADVALHLKPRGF